MVSIFLRADCYEINTGGCHEGRLIVTEATVSGSLQLPSEQPL